MPELGCYCEVESSQFQVPETAVSYCKQQDKCVCAVLRNLPEEKILEHIPNVGKDFGAHSQ